jgi:threonine dehydrogenase-like Zn-dependent dehydrogenase
VRPLITNVLPLEETREGFEMMHEKRGNPLKIMIKP